MLSAWKADVLNANTNTAYRVPFGNPELTLTNWRFPLLLGGERPHFPLKALYGLLMEASHFDAVEVYQPVHELDQFSLW